MTREKAIEMCKSIKHYLTAGNPVWSKEEVTEAIEMAVEALQVDLVLCKECKYYRPEFDACTVKGWNLSATHYPKVHESGFCYRGERSR